MNWFERFIERFGGWDAQPLPEPAGDPVRLAEVALVLQSIEALVAADGGQILLLGTRDGLVFVELRGACAHCGASDMTLDGVLEPRLRAALPWFAGLRVESARAFAEREGQVERGVQGW